MPTASLILSATFIENKEHGSKEELWLRHLPNLIGCTQEPLNAP